MNIVIVDDEAIIREWFVFMIGNFNEDKFNVVKAAKNGKEAYDYCINHKVDLVVTDIKMPVMDGIELIKLLKEEKPEIYSLVLSSHEDFQFATEALRYGAKDYILKAEVESEELRNRLAEIHNEIKNKDIVQKDVKTFHKILNKEFFKLRNIFLRDLLNGQIDITESIPKKKSLLNIFIPDKKLHIFAIGVKNYYRMSQEFSDKGRTFFNCTIVNILEELVQKSLNNGCVFYYGDGQFITIADFDTNSSLKLLEKIQHIYQRYSNGLKNHLSIEIAGGFYMAESFLPEIGQLKDKTLASLRYQLFYEKDTLGVFDDIQTKNDNKIECLKNSLIECLFSNNLESFKVKWLDYLENVKLAAEIRPEDVINNTLVIAELLKLHMFSYENKATNQEQIFRTRNNANITISSLINLSISLIDKCDSCIFERMKKYSLPIRRTLEYINNNYYKDISLSDIARYVNLNTSYLSVLFKKEVEVNFIDYLSNLRIGKSKTLLQNTDKSLNEIAEDVGYVNASYFTRVFKKNTGILPSEYKKSK